MSTKPKREIRVDYQETAVLVVGPLAYPDDPLNDVRITVDVAKLCNAFARKARRAKSGKSVLGNGAIVVTATGPIVASNPAKVRSSEVRPT
jgi:hypothetical protein